MVGRVMRIRIEHKRGDLLISAYGKTATGRQYLLGHTNLGPVGPKDSGVPDKITGFIESFKPVVASA